MERRDFLRLSGFGVGALVVPVLGRPGALFGATTPVPTADKKALADLALEAARSRGATYADVRIGRYLNQFVVTREDKVENLVNTESYGVGVRVLADGTWGFAATSLVDPDSVARAAAQAVAIAKANAKVQLEPVQLAPVGGVGEVSWATPIEKNAFEVPISEKVEMLMDVNAAAMAAGASFINSIFFLVNEQKYFASTDGSYVDQDVHRIWPTFTVTVVDPESGKFKTRDALSSPMGMGWEYVNASPGGKVLGVVTRYGSRYDMKEDAIFAARQTREILGAKSVEPGKYDLVLDPSHLWLTIHESVGHPLELDRVLGYEANYAGTSFATLDKWRSKSFDYGSEKVNLVADKTQPGSLGCVAYDDEGVKCREWDLVKDGILVNYQATRDQVHILGEKESHGCCYADGWDSVQFQRMPNVSLRPGPEPLSVDEMIRGVEKGIYIIGDGSYSIDQQRYNFQFGGQLFYAIENGEISGMLRDVAYQSNTQEFWNSCVAICDGKDYRLGGSFFDGKGQPGQISAVSHGCSTTRFDGINVINTERKL
ncbi:MAG: TldD/PmbA family protein [Acidobacteriota bacterium]|nr:TldD/PmbA family protein [Acidobacteriota bacterium]MDH3525149.1 TldD/PmbA family protein [Acidobacteriota bacterium]